MLAAIRKMAPGLEVETSKEGDKMEEGEKKKPSWPEDELKDKMDKLTSIRKSPSTLNCSSSSGLLYLSKLF